MPGMPGIFMWVESSLAVGIPGIAVALGLVDSGDVDLAFEGVAFLVAGCVFVSGAAAAFFFAAVARLEGVAGFFFLVGAGIFIPGMLDIVVSCPACCGCWARTGAVMMTAPIAKARRKARGRDNEYMYNPKV